MEDVQQQWQEMQFQLTIQIQDNQLINLQGELIKIPLLVQHFQKMEKDLQLHHQIKALSYLNLTQMKSPKSQQNQNINNLTIFNVFHLTHQLDRFSVVVTRIMLYGPLIKQTQKKQNPSKKLLLVHGLPTV
ncbi:hypothetical protein PPERSA_12890 [Pseudocohnilembus persalinus]|uniref:Uncharacterized protein n=1 Tax=Pseudocohnilembus persalinus TaxID=266149 RepID=A0A0V0Q8D6_PSEPJ|nr:hypothetical protein PPERSA_12890 [Pseudocohnilembus persalinus]|eukprot:KRW98411.1 hypothetical protein PPERSA_12890 [Pseudocohnilembus persalinus]